MSTTNPFTPSRTARPHTDLVRVDRFTNERTRVATDLDAFGMLQWVRKNDPVAAHEDWNAWSPTNQVAKKWHTNEYYYTAAPEGKA